MEIDHKIFYKAEQLFRNYLRGKVYAQDLRHISNYSARFANKGVLDSKSEVQQRCFWLNMLTALLKYLTVSAGVETTLADFPSLLNTTNSKISGYSLTVMDIYHGILRNNRRPNHKTTPQFGFARPGYRRLSLELDYRIHFAIMSWQMRQEPYTVETLDMDLDVLEKEFASANFNIDHDQHQVTADSVFFNYRDDFEGIYLDNPDLAEYAKQVVDNDWWATPTIVSS